MQFDPQESLKQFYGSITDRRQVDEQIQWEMKNNPVMEGLSASDVGKVINRSIGGEKGAGFERFDSITRPLDALGYYAKELFSGAPTTPTNYVKQMRGESTRNWSDVGGDVGLATAKTFGVRSPEGLAQWENAGRSLPASAGMLALAAIPGAGLPLMAGATYGGAVDEAKSMGASSGKAMAVGAIDTAVNLLFLKAGAPVADKMAGTALNISLGPTAKAAAVELGFKGAAEALAASSGLVTKDILKEGTEQVIKEGGKQIFGRALLKHAGDVGAIGKGTAFAARLGAEAATEAVQSAVGISGQLLHEGILDYDGLKQHMTDPNYWATTLASEGVFAVLGTTIGRMREPNPLNEYTTNSNEGSTIFKEATSPVEDLDIPAKAKTTQRESALRNLEEILTGKKGETAISPLVSDSPEAISLVAAALQATGTSGLNANHAQDALEFLKSPIQAEALINEARSKPVSPTLNLAEGVTVVKVSNGAVAFTVEGTDPTVPFLVTRDQLTLPKPELLTQFPVEAHVAVSAAQDALHTRLAQDALAGPLQFDSSVPPEKQLAYKGFFESSGLLKAMEIAGSRVKFTNAATGDWFDSFNQVEGKAGITNIPLGDGSMQHYLHATEDSRSFDLHEIGHLVDYTLGRDGFGPEANAQWQQLKAQFANDSRADVDSTNILGAKLGTEMEQLLQPVRPGETPTPDQAAERTVDFQKYYNTRGEWAAQGFHGYMLGKQNPFINFVKTNFPQLHEVFTSVVNSLKSTFSKQKSGKPSQKEINQVWGNGQAEVKIFFDSLFKDRNRENVATRVNNIVKEKQLSPKVAESFIEAVVGGRTLSGEALAMEAIKDTGASEADMLDRLEFANMINGLDIPLGDFGDDYAGAAPTVGGLPNLRKLQRVDAEELKRSMAEKIASLDPAANPGLSEHLMNMEALETRGFKALQAADYVLSNKTTQFEKEVSKASLYDKGIMMLQVDAVLGRWTRGELPGQNGRYMWEPRKGTDFQHAVDEQGVNYAEQRKVAEIHFEKEFPILQKALKGVKTGSREEGFVGEDGTLNKKYGKRKLFDTLEEAAEFARIYNDNQNYPGYSFKPDRVTRVLRNGEGKVIKDADGKSVKSKEGFVVKHIRDDRKTVVAEYKPELKALSEGGDDWVSFDDQPEVKEQALQSHAEYLNDVNYEPHQTRMDKIIKRQFAKFRQGNANVFPKEMQEALSEYSKALRNPEQQTFLATMAKELGVGYVHIEDVFLGLVNRAELQIKTHGDDPNFDDIRDYAIFMPKEMGTLFENFVNYTKVWSDAELKAGRAAFYNGAVPAIQNDKGAWKHFEHGIMPREQPWFQEALGIVQHADVGGISRKNASGITYAGASPRSVVGKTMAAIERLHTLSFGGMQARAETNPLLKELGKIIDFEQPNQEQQISYLVQHLRGTGKLETLPDGSKKWVTDQNSEKRDDRVYVKFNSSKKLKPILDNILRMQNEAGGIMFKDVLDGNLAVGRNTSSEDKATRIRLAKEANDLIAKNFDSNNPKHKQDLKDLEEYLYRGYAYQEQMAKLYRGGERLLHEKTTANAFFSGMDFQGNAEQAQEIAHQLHAVDNADPQARIKRMMILTVPKDRGGLGWDATKASNFHDKWDTANMAIDDMFEKMMATPGYISERRMRRWHVKYTKQTAPGDKPSTGLRDFDTSEEALAFMKSTEKDPAIKLNVKFPTDSYENNQRYRTGTDAMDEVVNNVVEARKHLLEFVLQDKVDAGLMTPAELQDALRTMSGMAEDITSDSVTARLSSMMRQTRQFKDGRAELDMAYQQEESGVRAAILYARKITDAGYDIYLKDPRLAPYKNDLKFFVDGKNSLRSPDGLGQQIASKTAFSYFILGNFSSALLEAAQWPLALSHILVEEGAGILEAFRTPARLMAKSGHASMRRLLSGDDSGIWSKPHADLIHYAEFSNRLGIRPLTDISSDTAQARSEEARAMAQPGARGKLNPLGILGKAYDHLNGFYAFFSRFNAELCLTASYDVIKRKEFGNRTPTKEQQLDLFEKAIRISNKANGSWGRSNRPVWFHAQSQGMRTVGQLGWSLQGFASNHVANHLRLMKNSIGHSELGLTKEQISQSRKALAVLTTVQVAGLGVMGHTLAGGLSKAIANVFGVDPETEVMEFLDENTAWDPEDQNFATDLLTGGIFKAAGMPLDVQSRMSVAGLGPLNAYDGWNMANFGGPILSTLGGLVDGWQTVAKGDGSAESYMRFGLNFLPTGVQRGMRMEMFDGGDVFNQADRLILKPTVIERVGAIAGFSSRRYTDYMKAKTKALEANVRDGLERKRATAQIRNELQPGGNRFKALRMLEMEAPRLGMTSKELADQVAELNIVQTFGPASHQGSGPNAQKAAKYFNSPLPEVMEDAKYRNKFQTLQQLNMLPRDWQRQLFDANARDTARGMFGFQTATEARNQMRNPQVKSTVLSSMINQPLPGFQPAAGLSGFDTEVY